MSRKHAQRAMDRPVSRRYLQRLITRQTDDIISAIIHARQPGELADGDLSRREIEVLRGVRRRHLADVEAADG